MISVAYSILFLATVAALPSSVLTFQDDALIPVKSEGSEKWGYINLRGELTIAAEFDSALKFSEGLAAVKKGGKWGYIDHDGKIVVAPQFDRGEAFSEGLARVELGNFPSRSYGFIDRTGRLLVKDLVDAGAHFSEGFVSFSWGNSRSNAQGSDGYLDRSGNVVIAPSFDIAGNFREGRALVRRGMKWGFIDTKGEIVIPLSFEEAGDFCGGIAAAKKAGRWGFIDPSGQTAIEFLFDEVESHSINSWTLIGVGLRDWPRGYFFEGLACVRVGEKWGYLGRDGNWTIPPTYEEASPFGGPVAPAQMQGQWGFVDKKGGWVIPPRFASTTPFREGLAAVQDGVLWGYVDATGKMAIPPAFGKAYPFFASTATVYFDAIHFDGKAILDRNGKLIWKEHPEVEGRLNVEVSPDFLPGKWKLSRIEVPKLSVKVHQGELTFIDSNAFEQSWDIESEKERNTNKRKGFYEFKEEGGLLIHPDGSFAQERYQCSFNGKELVLFREEANLRYFYSR